MDFSRLCIGCTSLGAVLKTVAGCRFHRGYLELRMRQRHAVRRKKALADWAADRAGRTRIRGEAVEWTWRHSNHVRAVLHRRTRRARVYLRTRCPPNWGLFVDILQSICYCSSRSPDYYRGFASHAHSQESALDLPYRAFRKASDLLPSSQLESGRSRGDCGVSSCCHCRWYDRGSCPGPGSDLCGRSHNGLR